MQKVTFQQYYPYILQIFDVISKENKLLPLYPTHLKNVTTLPCKMHNIIIWLKVFAFLQMLEAVKRAGCGLALVALKRTGCGVRQMECQASNVTANVQSDHLLHGYMLPVFFVTDQLHRPPCCAEIQPISQQDDAVTQLVRIANWYLIHVKKMKKMKNLCKFYKLVGATFFRCSG